MATDMARLSSRVLHHQGVLMGQNAALNAPTRKGSSDEARISLDYKPALNAHASHRFHAHFMIIKMLKGYYQGYNPGVSLGTN